ncbi:MAG: putative toxin-antitoxin system toxin component, PIN family [Desulfobulbaceae bacterium DB1]|nr:MAG: putative toxin-antitoxin system toxin component, PIN family [Desulfobulbaceae bacterium DB1]
MKIVLDTNVFISGIFFSGPPLQILKAWRAKKVQIVLSKEILDEYRRVGQELAKKFPSVDISQIIELFTIHAEFVDTEGISVTISEDPDDNMFIECAIASKCKLIVSGDRHLLSVSGFHDIAVLKPREFVDSYLK